MRTSAKILLALVCLSLVVSGPLACRTPRGDTRGEKRATVRSMRDQAMKDLYKEKPGAKGLVDRSVGYAAFSTIGTNLGFISTQKGYGLLRDRSSGKETYMDMLSLGGGFGLGIKDTRTFFIFLDQGAMRRFVEHGIEFGGQVEGVATTSEQDGVDFNATQNLESVQAKVLVLQLTKAGLSGQATLQGTRFRVDEELN